MLLEGGGLKNSADFGLIWAANFPGGVGEWGGGKGGACWATWCFKLECSGGGAVVGLGGRAGLDVYEVVKNMY